jgi:hypothetical protein
MVLECQALRCHIEPAIELDQETPSMEHKSINSRWNAWDDKLCEVCNRLIEAKRSVGYLKSNIWLCRDCFEAFAIKNNLGFVVGHGLNTH